jgi:hypothetical protein
MTAIHIPIPNIFRPACFFFSFPPLPDGRVSRFINGRQVMKRPICYIYVNFQAPEVKHRQIECSGKLSRGADNRCAGTYTNYAREKRNKKALGTAIYGRRAQGLRRGSRLPAMLLRALHESTAPTNVNSLIRAGKK